MAFDFAGLTALLPIYRPYTNVQPFTVRDGATYQLQIETVIDWLVTKVIPHIDKETGELTVSWETLTTQLIQDWEQRQAAMAEQVDTAVAGIGDKVEQADAARLAAEAARDLAAQFASDAEEIQDGAVTTIVNNAASSLREALNELYTLDSDFAPLADTVNTGRLAPSALDTRFNGKADTGYVDDAKDALTAEIERIVIDVSKFPTVQEALDAGRHGATYLFPSTMGIVDVPENGFVLKFNNLTIEATGVEFHVHHWGTPAFEADIAKGGANGITYRLGKVKYVGVRGDHTGPLTRGSAPYTSGCGVWTNGDYNYVEQLETDGMPTPIFFSSWNGTSMTDRMGYGNRIGYLHATRYNFGLLYVKQTAFDWGNAYLHDDLDDSGGANPTHAIYCSAAAGQRAGVGQIGRWITERNYKGHAYLFKYSDKLTFGALNSDDCAGIASFQNVDDLIGQTLQGSRVRGITADRSVVFAGADHCKRVNIRTIDIAKSTGDQTLALGLWVDERCDIGSISIETDHSIGMNVALPEVTIRGKGVGTIGTLDIRAKTVHNRPVELGDGTVAGAAIGWFIRQVRSAGSDITMTAIPVSEYALSHSNAWGDGSNWMQGAAPIKGNFRRGMRWSNSAPASGVPRGWLQTVNGGLYGSSWVANTAVALGAWVKLSNNKVIRYLTAGTTGSTEPNPSTVGETGTDGGATFEYMSVTAGTALSEGNL